MRHWEERWATRLDGLSAEGRMSAANLLHYLALRSEDVRTEQAELSRLGLSSLGRAEPNALGNIRAVRRALEAMAQEPGIDEDDRSCGMDEGAALLRRRTTELLGHAPEKRAVRIMVTMPSEAAHDYALVRSLVLAGMNVMRINCAHDGAEAWRGMVENLRRAREETGRDCRVVMDIEGPKLRTGAIEPGPRVVAWPSRRNAAGDLIRPALVGIGPGAMNTAAALAGLDAWLPVEPVFAGVLDLGSEVEFTDRPGRKRMLKVIRKEDGWAVGEVDRSAFVEAGTELEVRRGPGAGMRGRVGDVPALEEFIDVRTGDELVFTADQSPGRNARRDSAGHVLEPARVPITLIEAVDAVRMGHRVLLDDGKAEAEVVRTEPGAFVIKVLKARATGLKLRSDKGVNLPDTKLPIPALTAADREALGFVAEHADAVEFSFVRTPQDLLDLREALRQAGGAAGERLKVVLKIETAAGFENLPELLLAALTWPAAGVMIARGDLAVEVGYQRMAEVQEEILWLCEAAHVPVIWATQVLETLAKKGIPSRSEITDAAMGERAECVMLNKGPYVLDAVKMLDDILRRMAGHQVKKRAMLRKLSVARGFGGAAEWRNGADTGGGRVSSRSDDC
jgi:pyruvate kinase